jgi:hypothetical protein
MEEKDAKEKKLINEHLEPSFNAKIESNFHKNESEFKWSFYDWNIFSYFWVKEGLKDVRVEVRLKQIEEWFESKREEIETNWKFKYKLKKSKDCRDKFFLITLKAKDVKNAG